MNPEEVDWWRRHGYQENGRDPGPTMPAPFGGWVTFDPQQRPVERSSVVTVICVALLIAIAVCAIVLWLQ